MALLDVLDVSAYAPEAVAGANSAAIGELGIDQLIVRAASAAADRRVADAGDCLRRAAALGPMGHAAFVTFTALMFLAADGDDQRAFEAALNSWIGARTAWPGNFDNRVIAAPELQQCLANADADMVRYARTAVTAAESGLPSEAFMTVVTSNVEQWIRAAVADNAEWLEGADPATYRLRAANEDLREVYVVSTDPAQPELTIALRQDLTYMGAFISH